MVRIGILHDMTQADGGAGTRRTVKRAIDEVAASPAGASLPEVEMISEIAEGHRAARRSRSRRRCARSPLRT